VPTETKVRDVMTPDPLTVVPDATVRSAIGLLREKGIQHLPVIDDAGRLVGMLTDRDLRHAALVPALAEHLTWEHRRLKALRVRDVMTWTVVTTDPDVTVVQAGWTMFQRRIGSLPVVEGGRLVGILTEHDVLQALGKGEAIDPDQFVW
jgi:acetoin utilization protein AcuB